MSKKNKKISAAILVIGNEILSGRTVDKNISFLSSWLNNNLGIKVFVITNQSAIARGYMTLEEYYIINSRFLDLLKDENAFIDKVYFSPYHIDGKIKEFKKFDISRKPNPGMLFQASKEFNISLNKTWLIGGNVNDIIAGCNAHVLGCSLVLTGHGKKFKKEVKNLKCNAKISINKNLL